MSSAANEKQKVRSDAVFGPQIGQGGNGVVREVALRALPKESLVAKIFYGDHQQGMESSCLGELGFARCLNWPLRDVLWSELNPSPILVWPRYTAFQRIDSIEGVEGAAIQLLQQLETIHRNGFVHGDISMANIMWDGDRRRYLLIDAGSMFPRWCCPPGHRCTSWYRAPELWLDHRQQGPATDIWALGWALLGLAFGQLPVAVTNSKSDDRIYQDLIDLDVYHWVVDQMHRIQYRYKRRMATFFQRMLSYSEDGKQPRPSASDLLQDPWLADNRTRGYFIKDDPWTFKPNTPAPIPLSTTCTSPSSSSTAVRFEHKAPHTLVNKNLHFTSQITSPPTDDQWDEFRRYLVHRMVLFAWAHEVSATPLVNGIRLMYRLCSQSTAGGSQVQGTLLPPIFTVSKSTESKATEFKATDRTSLADTKVPSNRKDQKSGSLDAQLPIAITCLWISFKIFASSNIHASDFLPSGPRETRPEDLYEAEFAIVRQLVGELVEVSLDDCALIERLVQAKTANDAYDELARQPFVLFDQPTTVWKPVQATKPVPDAKQSPSHKMDYTRQVPAKETKETKENKQTTSTPMIPTTPVVPLDKQANQPTQTNQTLTSIRIDSFSGFQRTGPPATTAAKDARGVKDAMELEGDCAPL